MLDKINLKYNKCNGLTSNDLFFCVRSVGTEVRITEGAINYKKCNKYCGAFLNPIKSRLESDEKRAKKGMGF